MNTLESYFKAKALNHVRSFLSKVALDTKTRTDSSMDLIILITHISALLNVITLEFLSAVQYIK